MIGPDGYGSATIRREDDGSLTVVEADDVIGISLELLLEYGAFYVDDQGMLLLAGDWNYRYRPARFHANVYGLGPGQAVEGSRFLVCERVRSEPFYVQTLNGTEAVQ